MASRQIDRDARSASSANPSAWSVALLVVGVAIGMYGGFAVIFIQSFGVFIKPISQGLGWGRAQASLITTMGFLGYAIASPVLGALIDRWGAGRVVGVAIPLFSAGVALLAIAPGQAGLFALISFMIGAAGSATAPSGYMLVLSKAVRERLGLAIGLAMIGMGIGASTIPLIAQSLISHFGWRGGYLGLAALSLTLGAIAWVLCFAGRAPPPPTAARIAAPSQPGLTLRQALGAYRFWLIAITGLLVGGMGFGASAHLAAALSDRGLSAQAAASAAGLAGLGLFLGRTASAMLMDRVFAPLVTLIGFMLGGLGLGLIALAPAQSAPLLLLAAFLTGLLVGTEGDVMPILTRRYFGVRSFGAIYGCIVGLVGLGGILGPLAFGVAFDRLGGYRDILLAGASVCVISGGAIMALGRYAFPPGSSARPSPPVATLGEPA